MLHGTQNLAFSELTNLHAYIYDGSMCPGSLQVNLGDLSKHLGLGSGNLRLADEAAMLEKLKVNAHTHSILELTGQNQRYRKGSKGSIGPPVPQVGRGCASALALLFDTEGGVKLLLDEDLVQGGHPAVHLHPMTNTATLGMAPADLLRFLQHTGHPPILHAFP